MTVDEVVAKIGEVGIVPVIRAHAAGTASLAVEAVYAGGMSIVEITMTVPSAVEVIEHVVNRHGKSVLIGAGTVTSAEQARACMDAGAQFLVSPGLSTSVLRVAAAQKVLAIPGVFTPSEIMAAQGEGASLMKIFPCGSGGGAKHIKSLKGPFPEIRMIPTGGVNLAMVREYFSAGAFALGVGSELVNEAALREGKKESVAECARQYLEAVRRARA